MAKEAGIRKLPDGRYQVDIRPDGRGGRRHRRIFPTLREARYEKNRILARADRGEEWRRQKKDTRRLQDLIDAWHRLYGITLKDSGNRKRQLDFVCGLLGNPVAASFHAEDFLVFRNARLAAGISANTCNHYLSYLKAVFNRLIKLDNWKLPNPLQKIERLKFDESNITYLETGQIEALLSELAKSSRNTLLITKICLATGARWSEAETLHVEMVKDGLIHFVGTKSGKKRSVPVDDELEREIKENRKGTGRLFIGTHIKSFSSGLRRAGIELPRGQRSHVLRHSFAVHFMLNRGNILDLQKILGHSTLDMTLRYAQHHPDYLADAVTKNPLANLKKN
uniref:Site-specific recombinase XerD n=1 Tax=Candidatus Kentrum sp. LFY TaxID=2126342 RepID=A0A450WT32_9GAMM|nr:MAG: Site-specific recombinase XerD [Candidatus Kentron sp. LFY]